MSDRGEIESDAFFAAEGCHYSFGEIRVIVGDDAMRVAQPVDDLMELTSLGWRHRVSLWVLLLPTW